VTILHRSGTPLKAFDQDMVKAILEASAASGISVIPNETPTRIVPHGSGY